MSRDSKAARVSSVSCTKKSAREKRKRKEITYVNAEVGHKAAASGLARRQNDIAATIHDLDVKLAKGSRQGHDIA
jgi:hypothetical protein